MPTNLSPSLVNALAQLRRLALCVFAASLLSACATDRTYGASSSVELTDLATLPAPQNSYNYVIGPQELLNVTVTNSELLSGPFLTDGAGQIAFPLVGTLNLNGMTPNEAARLIADNLRGDIVKRPQVNVIPEEIEELEFSVGGQVKKPGSYPVVNNLTLMRAMNIAGGQTEFSDLNQVLVFREVGGQSYIGVYNLKAIRLGNVADPKLYPNDVVMVGESAAKRRLETILEILPTVISSAILVDRLGSSN
ncbi:MAG: polysaccharide biosynthesis/export family protein [Erythrobacter sp.]